MNLLPAMPGEPTAGCAAGAPHHRDRAAVAHLEVVR
jgi:hypothetical protein